MKSLYRLSLLLPLLAAVPAHAAESAAQSSDWYPSVYGAKDEIGAANLLTPEVVLQSVQLVKQGKTLPLAVPVDKDFRRSATAASAYIIFSLVSRTVKRLAQINSPLMMNW